MFECSVCVSLTILLLVHLTGTKLGCAEGGCGACSVMVSQYDRTEDKVTHISVNACLAPLCSLDGTAVTTVEGIGSTRTSLHPCQVCVCLYMYAYEHVFTFGLCAYTTKDFFLYPPSPLV